MIREHRIPVDGRHLSVLDAGEESGPAVFVSHGTPGSALLWRGSVEDVESRGMRLISYDRPGYGGSDPHTDRRVADAARDIAAAPSVQWTKPSVSRLSGARRTLPDSTSPPRRNA